MLKNKFSILLAVAVLALASCAKDGEVPQPTPDAGKDIVDQVSQYEQRAFDGQKRAGVFYEIFVRSFADSDSDGKGDLNGVTAKLNYLDDMGVAGIWLMPVYTCNSYHGYDVIDYRSVNSDYGTNADLENLIKEAHKRNIRVILDFVPNHMSNHSPWFTEACASTSNPYRDFFHFSTTNTTAPWYPVLAGTTNYFYHGDFDRSMPDLNYGPASTSQTNATFKAMADAAKFWVDKGVDGFRLDAVKHIYDNDKSDENPVFLKKFYDELNGYFQGKSTLGFNDIYMVGECWMGLADMAKYYQGLPALFDFDGWSKYLAYAITNSHAKWFPKDVIAQQAEFGKYRSDFIQATKLSNHDEDRARTTLGGSLTVSLERSKMAAAVLLTSVGSPYIYYGEEIGMLGSKATGDLNVREPMLWSPKAEDTFRPTWTPSVNSHDISVGNVSTQAGDVKSLYNVYRKFLRLRNTYPALALGSIALPEGFDDSDAKNKQIMAFVRSYEGENLLVVHNVSAVPGTYTYPRAVAAPVCDMNGVKVEKLSDKCVLTMPAYSSVVIEL